MSCWREEIALYGPIKRVGYDTNVILRPNCLNCTLFLAIDSTFCEQESFTPNNANYVKKKNVLKIILSRKIGPQLEDFLLEWG